ncbi:MAG: cupin domain-containing protein [Mucilaginibacter sp.]|jgi:quercetin dioxygenase-like cupin family protein|uniref:cupin domain-containing protein n=1 Tax=Mucilaginibacter sp. TaxID=1882438 RepID=UPI003561EDDF
MISTMNYNQPQTGENIEMTGTRKSVILSTECSGGHLTIIEEEISVGACSTPHVSTREDKVIFVADGKFILFADGEKYEAEKGCNIFIPRGVLHNFKNAGTQTGKLLITITPFGQENFLKDLCLSVKVFGKDPAVMRDVAKRNGVVLA